jgi:uncharacterized membrane protein YccC
VKADQPFLVRHADLVFAFKTFAAAMLALVVALWLDLPRPYWAMATVFVASHPLAGATGSKAFYRVLGTLIGAAATVAIVPNLVNAPELLCLIIALWVGLCLYLSLLDSTPRSYVFMLAGYTVAFIGFPAVTEPASIFDIALARVEEISLGIICASLVSTIVLPCGVGPCVTTRVDNWLSDARRISMDVLSGRGNEKDRRTELLRLATDAVEIDTLAYHLAYDGLADIDAARGLRGLRLHMLMVLPLLASIDDRIAALGNRLRTTQPALADLLDNLANWVASDDHERQAADRLRAAIAAQQPKLDSSASWDRITLASLLIRLHELVGLSYDCRALRGAIAAGEDASRIKLAFHPEDGAARVGHRDHGMALWSGAVAIVAILICCGFWIGSGWSDGVNAPMFAAVGCSLFATQDDPASGIRSFTWWMIVSIVIVAIYLFALLPGISNVEILIAALAPSFLVFGILIARPASALTGMVLGLVTATLLALQSAYSADFAVYANFVVPCVIGMAAADVVTRLTRSVGGEWSARRLLRTNWVALASAAEQRGRLDRPAFAGVMLNRLGLLAPRLAAVPDSDLRDVDSLGELCVGLNIVDLRRACQRLAPRKLRAIDDMLDQLAVAFRSHVGGPMPPELLTQLDLALTEAITEAGDDVSEGALIGLVGIRQGLFPDAPAHQPKTPDPSISRRVAA